MAFTVLAIFIEVIPSQKKAVLLMETTGNPSISSGMTTSVDDLPIPSIVISSPDFEYSNPDKGSISALMIPGTSKKNASNKVKRRLFVAPPLKK